MLPAPSPPALPPAADAGPAVRQGEKPLPESARPIDPLLLSDRAVHGCPPREKTARARPRSLPEPRTALRLRRYSVRPAPGNMPQPDRAFAGHASARQKNADRRWLLPAGFRA